MGAERRDERRALRIVEQLLDTPDPDRERALRELCGGDEALRLRVSKLLLSSGEDIALAPEFGELFGAIDEDVASEGARIGGYEIVRCVGRGGMGEVYEARQREPERRVAIKLLREGLFGAGARQRFAEEARLLAHLRHPGIAQVIEAGVHVEQGARGRRELPFLVLEFLEDAQPVVAFAEQRGLPIEERMALLVEILRAVQHGHQRGVIHRDLKPQNLLVDGEGRVKVIDFGVAKVTTDELLQFTSMTRDGQVIGTLGYIAPENLTGEVEVADVRADVYALGAVACQLVAGRMPFALSGVPFAEAVTRITTGAVGREVFAAPGVDADLAAVIRQALARDPGDRYASAQEFADDLQRWLQREPVRARRPSSLRTARLFVRRNPALAAALVLILLLVVGGSLAFVAVERNARAASDRSAYRSSVVGVRAMLEAGEIAQAIETLQAAPETMRAWEWRYLRHAVDSSTARMRPFPELLAERGNLDDCDYDPGRDLVLAGNDRGEVRLVQRETGEVVDEWQFDGDARFARFCIGHQRILVGGIDSACRLLNRTTGTEVATFAFDPGNVVNMLAVSSDSTLGACAAAETKSRNGFVDVFDLVAGERLHRLEGERSPYVSVAFAGGGRYLIAGRFDGRIDRWDLRADGGPVRTTLRADRHVRHNNMINCLAVSEDGERLAASGGGSVTVWAIAAGELLHVIGVSAAEVAFHHQGKRLLVATRGERDLADVPIRDGAMRRSEKGFGHVGFVTRICVDSLRNRIVTAGLDGVVRSWEVGGLGADRILRHSGSVRDVAASRDGEHVVSVTSKGSCFVWNAKTGKRLAMHSVNGGLRAVVPHPQAGKMLLVGDGLRELEIGKGAIDSYGGPDGGYVHAAFVGALVVAAHRDGTVHVLRDGEPLAERSFADAAGCRRVVAHPDGEHVLLAIGDGRLLECSTEDLRTVCEVGRQDGIEDVVYLPHAPFHVVGSASDDSLRLFERTGNAFAARELDRGYRMHRIACHPSEPRLFVCATTGQVTIWNTDSWQKMFVTQGHRAMVLGASFAPALDALVTCSMDRTVKIWRAAAR